MTLKLVCLSMLVAAAVFAIAAAPQAQEKGPVKLQVTEYDMARVALPSKLSDVELKGRHLFFLRCAACHTDSANGYGPRLDQARVKALGDEGVRATIAAGSLRMPGFRHMFEPAQVDQIVAYLKSVR